MTMICEACALRNAEDEPGAWSIDTIRAQRLLLAVLSGCGDVAEEIGTQLGKCPDPDCVARLAGIFLIFTTNCLIHMYGSESGAAEAIGQGLLNALDAQR